MKYLQLICFAAIASALSGCETVGKTYDTVSGLWDTPIILPCPNYRILSDASRIVSFRDGQGRDLIDINIDGRIGDLEMECATSINKKTNSGNMEVDLRVSFSAKKGPANTTNKAPLPYFVSIIDQEKNVLYREEFIITGKFIGNQSAANFFGKTIKLELPLTPKISPRDYIIYIGFLLTRDQLKYNQRVKKNRRI